ncbi:metal-dependent hydrolase [Falsiroseomonas selenitidurans]|uniref:Metal-dependent hydrolase n=1 Tax=Falsiroseomonas selenitidurans TaxID=2716335 RepID=A0ABX1E0E8_9PROT|nr:metal-dependent hydrolase [Falsiroseomonas selenitidurans]NKC30120.1 metal-dependent hydrolase [Falsiroseomonas selenitidurans]
MSQTRIPPRETPIEIIRRRVRLAYDAVAAKAWTRLPRVTEDGLNAISFLFPAGETFFVRSVAHYRDRITDPALKDAASRFIFQEAMHSKEHERSNAALREANVLGAELEVVAKVLLGAARWFLPPATRLAVTCALEHFTAMLAERLLSRRWLAREGTDPAFAGLWLWHAAEEIEHKAVCFDVYEHVFGRGVLAWLHRIAAMALVSFCGAMGLLTAFTVVRVKLALRGRRGRARKAPDGKAGPSLGNLFATVSAQSYFAYFRRDFHPWDQDDRPLLEEWKRENPGFGLHEPAA